MQIGQLDEAIASGNRALAIARSRGDLEIRILTTTYLEQAHYLRGEYEQVIELATENIAALPANRGYEHLGSAAPAAVYDRGVLALSLALLGRFADAQERQAEAVLLAEPTRHAFTIGAAGRNVGRTKRGLGFASGLFSAFAGGGAGSGGGGGAGVLVPMRPPGPTAFTAKIASSCGW